MRIWRRHLGKAPLLVQLNGSDARKYTKKIIARLLVDVETQIIPHFKPEEEFYPTKNRQGNQSKRNAAKKILNNGK